jgi:hypothetical protein
MRMRWLPQEDDAIRAVLPLASSVGEAAKTLSKRLGRPISYAMLHCRMTALGLTGLSNPLGRGQRDPGATIRTAPVTERRQTRASADVEIPITWDEEDEPTGPHPRTDPAPAPSEPPDPVRDRDERDERHSDKRTIDRLVEQIREARARNEFLDAIRDHHSPPVIFAREHTSGIREMAAIALLSDLHVEEPVDPVAVAYRNEYNLEIAEKRLARFFQSIAWEVEHHRASGKIALRDLVLWFGGDMMSGYIHPELVESNLLSPTETMLWLIPRLVAGVRLLLDVIERIEIPCSYGNHGRTTDKRRVSTGADNSYEFLMYSVLAERFADEPRVHFEITRSPHQYVQVYDWTLHFHHGDDVRYQGGVGGLGIPLLKAVPAWERVRRADIHNIGHHHQFRDYGRAVVNGSLIGYNAYAQSIRADYEPPQQAFYLMDKVRGKSHVTPLWVAESSELSRQGTP